MGFTLFKNKKEIDKLRNELEEVHESTQAKIKSMQAEIFRINHPNGDIYTSSKLFYGKYVCIDYYYHGDVKHAEVCCVPNRYSAIVAYKTVFESHYIYMGVQFKYEDGLDKKFFIVDIKDGKSVEVVNPKVMESTEWIPLGD